MTRTTDSLSIEEARKLVLLSQRVPPKKQTGKALDATLSAIENLGYIQIDIKYSPSLDNDSLKLSLFSFPASWPEKKSQAA